MGRRLLLCGLAEVSVQGLLAHLPPAIDARVCTTLDEAKLALGDGGPLATVCTGAEWPLVSVRELIASVPGSARVAFIITAAGSRIEDFAPEIEAGQLFYLTAGVLAGTDLAALVLSAMRSGRINWNDHQLLECDIDAVEHVSWLADRAIMQEDTAAVSALWQRAATELVDAERSVLLVNQRSQHALYAAGIDDREERWESAAVGLASLVLRTGRSLRRERADQDPAFDRDADDPQASGGERFLAVPIITGHSVLGVATAVRGADRPPFDDRDSYRLELLATQIAPVLDRLRLEEALNAQATRNDDATEQRFRTYRGNAVAHYVAQRSEPGHALRLDPLWIRWAFGLLLVTIVLAILGASVTTVTEYANGPAVIRIEGRYAVSTSRNVAVHAVEVRNGARVLAGQPLLRVRDTGESNAVIRPLVSPWAGTVADLRVRAGQQLDAGQEVATIVSQDSRPYLEALLPGTMRPLLRIGMPLRLKLDGFRDAFVELEIIEIGDEVVGPQEARERLGAASAETFTLPAQVMPVRAMLDSQTFRSGNQDLPLYPGMTGSAQVPVRRRSLLEAILPSVPGLGGDVGS